MNQIFLNSLNNPFEETSIELGKKQGAILAREIAKIVKKY